MLPLATVAVGNVYGQKKREVPKRSSLELTLSVSLTKNEILHGQLEDLRDPSLAFFVATNRVPVNVKRVSKPNLGELQAEPHLLKLSARQPLNVTSRELLAATEHVDSGREDGAARLPYWARSRRNGRTTYLLSDGEELLRGTIAKRNPMKVLRPFSSSRTGTCSAP
jgi:hypothetical protein